MTYTTRDATGVSAHARAKRAIALALLSTLALTISLFGANKASAAPGDPFDALTPYVFIGQNSPSELFRAVAGAGGSVTFENEGGVQDVTYNALGYDTTTNYLYGVANTGNGTTIPDGAVIRIGQDGVVTRVGTATVPVVAFWGAIARAAGVNPE